MSIERERFLRDLERQCSFYASQSPLYANLLAALKSDLSADKPRWFMKLQEAWQGRSFVTDYEGPVLLLASLHHRALLGKDRRLDAVFPTCGGKTEDAGSVIINCLNTAPQDFWDEIKDLRLQANESSRAIGWLLVACAGFTSRGLPFHLVDMGTSAGLNLIGDYLPKDWTLTTEDGKPAPYPERWRDSPFPVLSRTGLDAFPRHLSDPKDRLWLKACIWADAAGRHARFEQAAELFLKLSQDISGPKIERCDFIEMPQWVASKIRPHPEEGLLLYNSRATGFLSDTKYEQLKDGIAKTLEPWEDRGFWAELETPRGQGLASHQLTVHRLMNGRLESKVLATMTVHPKEVLIISGWNFLAPLTTPRPPRITREEPPKNLEPGRYRFG